ncbi:hypothetical protein [Antrihabitans stalactiti]|uniref:Peptidase n=1 Tax=Antrihabitans stalactiti TaxID=2584121 RepID=A0A848KLC6_9NOCA|nr:hypothetical protein [Antrihabitans stalactiti]NMN97462.1 hypothetical protein [Antrihabitans stalactiti]
MRWLIISAITVMTVIACPVASSQPADPSTPPAPTGLGVRLLEIPVDLQDDPRAQTYIVDNLPPGTTITRKIDIQNNTGAYQSVDLYPGAATIRETGGWETEAVSEVNELTTWMSIDKTKLDMNAGEADPVTVTIAVPKDAPEGEQYGVVWAQIKGPDPGGSGAILVNRVGIRVYLSVGPGNGPPANFKIDKLTPRRNDAGIHEVVAEVTNTGGRAVDLGGDVTLTEGPGGLALGPKRATAVTVAPDKTAQVVFSLGTTLPAGPWTVTVALHSGLLHKTATATLTFPDSGVGESVSITEPQESSPLWTAVFVGAGIGALVVAALLGVTLFLRRRQAK